MTETATEITGLSKLDVRALREADRVSFHHNGETGTHVCATKEVRNGGPFEERERYYRFDCDSEFSGTCNRKARCSELIYRYSDEWQTVAEFLRPGDRLTAHWCADGHRNGYLERAVVGEGTGQGMGLHADSLSLVIRRGEKKFTFLLRVQICPANSARMIQP